jgi:hypothetical protein
MKTANKRSYNEWPLSRPTPSTSTLSNPNKNWDEKIARLIYRNNSKEQEIFYDLSL